MPYRYNFIDIVDCIEVLTGAEKKKKLDQGGKIFYLSAGWLLHWQDMFDRRFGWDLIETWFEIGGITKIVALDDGCWSSPWLASPQPAWPG